MLAGCCLGTATDAAEVTFTDSPFTDLLGFTQPFSGAGNVLESPDDLKDPKHLAERWARLWSEKKLDGVVEMYSTDAVFLTGQGARITGKDAIRALLKTAFDAINPDLKVRSILTEQSGNLAYDSGEYSETLTPVAGGAKREGKGNYVMILKRQRDGNWLIVQHVWTDVPAEPAQ